MRTERKRRRGEKERKDKRHGEGRGGRETKYKEIGAGIRDCGRCMAKKG